MNRRARTIAVAATALAVGSALGAPGLAAPRDSAETPTQPVGVELVGNGGFEDALAGWTVDARTKVVNFGHTGRAAAWLVATESGVASIRDRPNSERLTAVGASYRASAWVLAEVPGASVRLTVREVEQRFVLGTNARVLVRAHRTADTLPDRLWHQVVLDFTVGGGHQLDVALLASVDTPGTGVIVDDISLARLDGSVVPEEEPPTGLSPSAGATCDITGFTAFAEPGESRAAALARRDDDLGRAPVLRVFHQGLPESWPGAAGAADRDVVVSFKADPTLVLSGALDARLTRWFATAPTDHVVYWTYYHEPEDQIEHGIFTAAQYRAAWRHLAELAHTAGPANLKATLILMAWSVNPRSGRTWTDYYPGDDVVDVIGWDAYNLGAKAASPYYDDPRNVFDPPAAVSVARGKPFGFAEWGSRLLPGDDGTRRAAWISAAAQEQARLGAVFSTYFDANHGGDYRLTDAPSRAALRTAITC